VSSYVWGSVVGAAALATGYLLNFLTARSTARAASAQDIDRDRRTELPAASVTAALSRACDVSENYMPGMCLATAPMA